MKIEGMIGFFKYFAKKFPQRPIALRMSGDSKSLVMLVEANPDRILKLDVKTLLESLQVCEEDETLSEITKALKTKECMVTETEEKE